MIKISHEKAEIYRQQGRTGGTVVAVMVTVRDRLGRFSKTIVSKDRNSYSNLLDSIRGLKEGTKLCWASLVDTGNGIHHVPVAFRGGYFGATIALTGCDEWRCIR